jgi:quercetin dioxygenase-like cupin family protein
MLLETQIRNLQSGPWQPLHLETGEIIHGVRGRSGASGSPDGVSLMGMDLIEMDAGAAFELHTHPGAHILYVLSGNGRLDIGGEPRRLSAGDCVYVPAAAPHGVSCAVDSPSPLSFIAVGFPHRAVDAPDRMHLVDEYGHA